MIKNYFTLLLNHSASLKLSKSLISQTMKWKQLLVGALMFGTANITFSQTFEWAKAFNGTGNNGATSMSVDASGNVIQ